MKRNRFDNLVPETPEDFHVSVLDALNRMETVRRRRQMQQRKTMYIAASIVAVFALSAMLLAAFSGRPVREDAVVAPQEVPETPRAAETVSFTVDSYEDHEESDRFRLNWTVDSTFAEPVLYEYEVRLTADGVCLREGGYPGFSINYEQPKNMAILAEEILGHSFSRHVQQENMLDYSDSGADGVDSVLITVNFYRPTAGFFEDWKQKFENEPHWMLASLEGGLEAWPINWSGNTEYQTPYGESSMTVLHDFSEYLYENPAADEAEAWTQMRDYAQLKRSALKMYGYAEFIKGYEVTIDLTQTDSQPEVKEILP